MKRFCTALLTLFFSTQVFAKHTQDLQCGVSNKENFSKEFLQKKSSGTQRHEINLNANGSIPVIAYYSANPTHIDGPVAITPEQIDHQLEKVSEAFGSPFHFVAEEIISINDPTFDQISINDKSKTDKLYSMFTSKPGKIHIFFSYKLDVCGWATSPHVASHQGIIMNSSCLDSDRLNPKILIHEMGHYFNLPHTFQNHDVESFAEKVIRDKSCTWRGDGFCDTEADFLGSRKYTYFVGEDGMGYYGCSFDPYSPNPNYDLPVPMDIEGNIFHPMTDNHMSYFMDNCREAFTPEQHAMMIKAFYYRTKKVSISEIDMKVFPNPANKSDTVKIIFDTQTTWSMDATFGSIITVYDSAGREITDEVSHYQPFSLIPFADMAGIEFKFKSAGTYVINVMLADTNSDKILRKISKKIIINN